MTTANKIATRVRNKVRDLPILKYGTFEMIEAINEALRELYALSKKYYNKYSFTVPSVIEIESLEDEIEWPSYFDDLIIEYSVIALTDGDYSTKEQVKDYWRKKAISLLSEMNTETQRTTRDYFHTQINEEGEVI